MVGAVTVRIQGGDDARMRSRSRTNQSCDVVGGRAAQVCSVGKTLGRSRITAETGVGEKVRKVAATRVGGVEVLAMLVSRLGESPRDVSCQDMHPNRLARAPPPCSKHNHYFLLLSNRSRIFNHGQPQWLYFLEFSYTFTIHQSALGRACQSCGASFVQHFGHHVCTSLWQCRNCRGEQKS